MMVQRGGVTPDILVKKMSQNGRVENVSDENTIGQNNDQVYGKFR